MGCEVITGIWLKSRLAPDTSEEVLPGESNITLGLPDAQGRFTGTHISGDPIVDGRCLGAHGLKPRIVFTRRHADGKTTTVYSGEVAFDKGNDLSFIVKGRFTRRSTDEASLEATNLGGDWTTEKNT